MACDTEWRADDRNLAEDVVSYCAFFIVASCVRRRVLCCLFSTLCGVLMIVLLRGTKYYLVMGFKVLLSTHWFIFWFRGVEISIPVGCGHWRGLVWKKEKVVFNWSWWHAGVEWGVQDRRGVDPSSGYMVGSLVAGDSFSHWLAGAILIGYLGEFGVELVNNLCWCRDILPA